MDWVKWAIPLIVVSVWILANLARIPREQPRPPMRRLPRPPEEEPPVATAESPGTDVDRFLQEVNRRRRESAEQRRSPEQLPPPREERRRQPSRRISPTDVPPETRTPPSVLPVAVPIPGRPTPRSRPAEAKPRPRSDQPVQTVVPEVLPVAPSTRLVDNTEFPGLAPDAAQPTLAPTAPPGSAQVVARDPLTESAKEVMAMLRDASSLRAAFLLREIFEPPLSRRGPRRPGGRV